MYLWDQFTQSFYCVQNGKETCVVSMSSSMQNLAETCIHNKLRFQERTDTQPQFTLIN